jgi:hypothetical protein
MKVDLKQAQLITEVTFLFSFNNIVPTSALEKRNNAIVTYGNEQEMTPDSLKRSNTGGGKRQMQPRQNPLVSGSPRNSGKSVITPINKKHI